MKPERNSRFGGFRRSIAALAASGALASGCGELQDAAQAPATQEANGAAPREGVGGTPFAPWADTGARSEALSALAPNLRLVGVRTAPDPARGGAVFVLPSGEQRAFRVGQEIAPGVRLASIGADHVVLAADNAQTRVALEENTPGAPALLAAAAPPAEPGFVLAGVSIRAEALEGAPAGWRVSGPAPPYAARAGLRMGDLIVAVNGAPPTPSAIPPDTSTQKIELTVVRASGERVTIALDPASRT
ncbi:MAG: hypothetical protein JNJ73_04790 [Hyphomonadaceae bacterium]|nr:hypothetical protein [Hyphomonadaceae bacterium]